MITTLFNLLVFFFIYFCFFYFGQTYTTYKNNTFNKTIKTLMSFNHFREKKLFFDSLRLVNNFSKKLIKEDSAVSISLHDKKNKNYPIKNSKSFLHYFSLKTMRSKRSYNQLSKNELKILNFKFDQEQKNNPKQLFNVLQKKILSIHHHPIERAYLVLYLASLGKFKNQVDEIISIELDSQLPIKYKKLSHKSFQSYLNHIKYTKEEQAFIITFQGLVKSSSKYSLLQHTVYFYDQLKNKKLQKRIRLIYFKSKKSDKRKFLASIEKKGRVYSKEERVLMNNKGSFHFERIKVKRK